MKKRPLLVDLTPLLDIILIMIFVILVECQQNVKAEKRIAVDQLTTQLEAATETLAADRLALQEEFEKKAADYMQSVNDQLTELQQAVADIEALRSELAEGKGFVSLTMISSSDSPDQRRLHIVSGIGLVEQDLDLTWDGEQREAFIQTLSAALDQAALIIFIYDSHVTFEADYRLISQAIEDLRKANPTLMTAKLDTRVQQ